MNRKINAIDLRRGRLICLAELGKKVRVQCECGTIKDVLRVNFLAGYTQSCGCLRDDMLRAAVQTHGHSGVQYRSETYVSWRAMKTRCENPNSDRYHWYGAKGIRVCERWNSFENFLQDMGERPFGKELGRLDDDKNYEKDNCEWMTHAKNISLRR